jgi:hypothetical protein
LSSDPDKLFYDFFLVWSFTSISTDADDSIYCLNSAIKLIGQFIKILRPESQKVYIYILLEILFCIKDMASDRPVKKMRSSITEILKTRLNKDLLKWAIDKLVKTEPFNKEPTKWKTLIDELWSVYENMPSAKVEYP